MATKNPDAYAYPYSNSPFGSPVMPVGIPNPSADLSAVYPNLSATNAQASSDLLSKLSGQLSPDTVNAIQDAAARFGVSTGMPGVAPGTLVGNSLLKNIGLTSEQEQQQGLQDYASLIPTVSGTQTVAPALQAQINQENAVSAAAPNPQQAQTYAQDLFDKYLNNLNRPAGGRVPASVRSNVTSSTNTGDPFGLAPGYSGNWIATTAGVGPATGALTSTATPGITPNPIAASNPYNGWNGGLGWAGSNNIGAIDPETGLPYSPVNWQDFGAVDTSSGE